MNPLFRAGFCGLAFLLVGCRSYTWTERYYRPHTAQQFPPVPANVPIPILDKSPSEPHTTVGRLSFTAHCGADYMLKAVEHNARRVGADAAVITSLDGRERPWELWVPPRTVYQPLTYVEEVQTTRRGHKKKEECERTTYTRTAWVPEWQPGHVQYGVDVVHSVDAYMIRFKAR